MRIRFTASSEKAASWPLRIGVFGLGFLGLWAFVNWMLGLRRVERPAQVPAC